MPFAAFIFDMDDLLVASAAIWRSAEEMLLHAIGHAWTPQLASKYKGMNTLDVAATIHRIIQPALPLNTCQAMMRDALLEGFSGEIRLMPGAADLVRRMNGQRPIAVASGSPPAAIDRALRTGGLISCFDELISSESVARGKPSPDVFLAAAKALGTPPGECLVFEDSLIGVQAAKAAGMSVFCVPSGDPAAVRSVATRVFASLADISDADVELRP